MKKIIRTLVTALAIVSLYACDNATKEPTTNNNTTNTEPTNTVSPISNEVHSYQALKDSVDNSWQQMMSADDDKLLSVARLLDEVSFNPKHDVSLVSEGRKMLQKLKKTRYTQTSLSDETIDSYDALTDSTIAYIIKVANETPDMDNYPLKNELIEEINQANSVGEIVRMRSTYDDIASEYNSFIQQNREKIGDKGEAYKTFAIIE